MAKIRSKRGFTIAEVIIALTIIVIVSISSLSVIASAVSANVVSETNIKAQYFAESAWECFKVSDTADEFAENVSFAVGEGLNCLNDGGEDTPEIYEYIYKSDRFNAEIEVDFESDTATFWVNVTDKKGREIVSFDYEKANKNVGGGT